MSCLHDYLSGARCRLFANGLVDAISETPSSHMSLRSRTVLPFSYPGLPRFFLEKRALLCVFVMLRVVSCCNCKLPGLVVFSVPLNYNPYATSQMPPAMPPPGILPFSTS